MKNTNRTKISLLEEIKLLKKENTSLRKKHVSKDDKKVLQSYYKNIFNNAPIPISIINKNTETEFVNKDFKKTFGYSLKDIPTSSEWFNKAYPDKSYRKKIISSWERVIKYNKKVNNEISSFKVTCKSGKIKDVVFRLSELDEERYILILEDITDRIKIEEALRESETKFRRILDDISLIGLMLNKEGKIIYCNNYLLDLTGYKLKEILGKNWFKTFIPNEIRNDLIKSFSNSASSKQKTYYENDILTKSGKRKFIAWSNLYFKNDKHEFEYIVSLGQDITERKRAENEFKIRDDRFNTFISKTTDAVNCWEFEKTFSIKSPIKKQIENIFNGKLVECNNHFAKVYGYKNAKEVLGKKFKDLIRDDQGSVRKLFTEFIKNNYKIENEESVEILKNGSKKYLLNNAHGSIENGELKRIWVNIKDISEIKKAQDALVESEKRFKGLFENATVGIYRTSPEGMVLMANPAIIRMQGFNTFEEMSKVNIAEQGYVNNQDRIYFQRIMAKFGEIKGFECEWWKNDGTKIFIRESATAIKDNEGNILYYEGIVEDITDKKKAENELLKNELRYRTLFSLSPSGILLTDLNGKILAANPAFCRSLGYKREEIIGKSVHSIAAPENRHEIEKNITLLKEGKTLKHTVRDLTKDGTFRYMELHETKIPLNENELGILTVANDITERKNFEEELIVAKEKAEKSDRLKTEFLAQISHEIRTPINSILSFTSYLHDELKDTLYNDIDNIFEIINKAGVRITRTIDMILNMSELQTGSYEPSFKKVNLFNQVIQPISNGFKRLAHSKNLKFNVLNKINSPIIKGDEYTLNQIFDNLINNAFKYTDKGSVNVIVGRNKNHQLYAEVSDTGIGISEEFLNIIFEPFSQEEQGYTRKFEGNGLGLALVKKYCDINNANICVKSKKGVGTTFTVTFEK